MDQIRARCTRKLFLNGFEVARLLAILDRFGGYRAVLYLPPSPNSHPAITVRRLSRFRPVCQIYDSGRKTVVRFFAKQLQLSRLRLFDDI